MARSMEVSEHAFVLESDRMLSEDQQTIFYISPRTVRQMNESASRYSKTTIENRRKRRTEIDPVAYNAAEEKEWLTLIKRIVNFVVAPNAPEKAFEHFQMKVADNPTTYKIVDGEAADDSSSRPICVTDTADPSDLLYIYRSMSPADVEEVIQAGVNYSILKEGSKNE